MITLKVRQLRRRKDWVILGLPGPDIQWCGPYDTKADAESDARGLVRGLKQEGLAARYQKKEKSCQ
jgi:hypothetical protein